MTTEGACIFGVSAYETVALLSNGRLPTVTNLLSRTPPYVRALVLVAVARWAVTHFGPWRSSG
jgi:hypothetical protein